jgi:hypothetical protein
MGRLPGLEREAFPRDLVRDHGFRWGYTWVKTQLHTAAWDPHRSARSPWASRVRRKSSAVVVPFEQDVGGFRPDDVFVRTESRHPRHAVWETPGGGVSS